MPHKTITLILDQINKCKPLVFIMDLLFPNSIRLFYQTVAKKTQTADN